MPELAQGNVSLRRMSRNDQRAFVAAARQSRALHQPWIFPPVSPQRFRSWFDNAERRERYLVWTKSDEGEALVGYVAINELTWGVFENGCLGYWVNAPWAGQGHMRSALELLVDHVFKRKERRLHRLEANIQPGNLASRRLVERLGFRLEGLSPRFLKLDGEWRDHERWAITREDWHAGAALRGTAKRR
ncbi:MAG: GNAT family N-acetyltransferase [Polyangiaceae bacterium]